MASLLQKYTSAAENCIILSQQGRVTKVIGLVISSTGPSTSIGEVCRIYPSEGGDPVLAEVVGFKDRQVMLMPLGEMRGINPGSVVEATGESLRINVGEELLGRVLGGLGEPLDGRGPISCDCKRQVHSKAPHPLMRKRINQPMITGIRSIDTFITCGRGQRLGIFAGSGVGKSVMMGMVAKHSQADVNVIGLIGERGREVRDFLERDLGEEGLKRAVVVSVTSDQPALIKVKGALVATTIAEFFRDQGKHVILMVDSITRIAMALREIGLAVGEPPATKGYTPSVYAFLPKFLERPGSLDHGSITGLYTILVEGDDFNEPISDLVRSILDGHAVLSRKLANRNHYPAVDVLESISRVMPDVTTQEHKRITARARELLAAYRESEDLITIGAYVKGSDPLTDESIAKLHDLNAFLKQDLDEKGNYEDDVNRLEEIVDREEIRVSPQEDRKPKDRQEETGSEGARAG
jgi:flagellum-specific ATP synthase